MTITTPQTTGAILCAAELARSSREDYSIFRSLSKRNLGYDDGCITAASTSRPLVSKE